MPEEYEDQELIPTPASSWGGGEDGFTIPLPSKNMARVRRTMDLGSLLASGSIPNPLRGVILEMMEEASSSAVQDKPSATMDFQKLLADDATLPQFMDMLNQTTCAVMVEPRVEMPDPRAADETQADYERRINAWKPSADAVSIFRITLEDKMYLFTIAQGAPAEASSFREESSGDVPPVSSGKPVPRPTKRTGGTGTARKAKPAAKKSGKPGKPAAKKQPARKR